MFFVTRVLSKKFQALTYKIDEKMIMKISKISSTRYKIEEKMITKISWDNGH